MRYNILFTFSHKAQQSDDDEDFEEEISPYQQLVSSFGSSNKSNFQQLKEKEKKLSKISDIVSNEQKYSAEIPKTEKHVVKICIYSF